MLDRTPANKQPNTHTYIHIHTNIYIYTHTHTHTSKTKESKNASREQTTTNNNSKVKNERRRGDLLPFIFSNSRKRTSLHDHTRKVAVGTRGTKITTISVVV